MYALRHEQMHSWKPGVELNSVYQTILSFNFHIMLKYWRYTPWAKTFKRMPTIWIHKGIVERFWEAALQFPLKILIKTQKRRKTGNGAGDSEWERNSCQGPGGISTNWFIDDDGLKCTLCKLFPLKQIVTDDVKKQWKNCHFPHCLHLTPACS